MFSDDSNTLLKVKKKRFCGNLITSPEFTCNLIGKTYYSKRIEPLNCTTENVISNWVYSLWPYICWWNRTTITYKN